MFALGQKKFLVWLGVLALFLCAPVKPTLAATVPMVLAESEQFEIVGRRYGDVLQFHVDWAKSNAPVENAQLMVEAAGKEVQASYDAAAGVYRISDAAWLAPLQTPGAHPLAFTLLAGDASDLLAGDLQVSPEAEADAALSRPTVSFYGLGLVVFVALGFLGWRRVRQGVAP